MFIGQIRGGFFVNNLCFCAVISSRACSSAWLERIPDKDEAGGSSPPRPTTNGGLAQLGERLPCKQEVSGSTPLSSTTVERLESLFQETVFVSFLFFDNSF